MAERTLRAVAHAGTWAEQRAAWAKLPPLPAPGPARPEQPRSSAQPSRPIPALRRTNPNEP